MTTKVAEFKTIETGDFVFVVPKSGNCWLSDFYSGEVQSVDDEAIRLTLIDWLIGTPSGPDVYLPKSDIGMMYMYGRNHNKQLFGRDVEKWEKWVSDSQDEIPTETS